MILFLWLCNSVLPLFYVIFLKSDTSTSNSPSPCKTESYYFLTKQADCWQLSIQWLFSVFIPVNCFW